MRDVRVVRRVVAVEMEEEENEMEVGGVAGDGGGV